MPPNAPLERARGWLAVFLKVERRLLALMMLLMVALYAFAILVREIAPPLASEVAWIDEATRILLVWMVFLGLGAALQHNRHIAMSTLFERLPPRLRWPVAKLIDTVGALFALYLTYQGWAITGFVARTGQISPTLGTSMAWLYAILPLGFLLLAIRYVLSLLGLFDRRSEGAGTVAGV